MIGRKLSHYQVLEEIGRGGMGVVYRAVDLKLDREVAIKVLPPELVSDPERKRRFIQEAKAAAKLEHPHIGVVHEIDEAEGTTFIVMELIRGEKLRDRIAKGRVPLGRALEIATDIAEGLARAHEEGIVHRDLKPANIMVTDDGHTKVIDFGLAKLTEPFQPTVSAVETPLRGQTDAGVIVGTVSYMSPEQARGEKLDPRSDIFSFGIVLHEMLTGTVPFRCPSAPETLNAIINTPSPSLDLSDHKDSLPELQRIAGKCLAKDPAERYQSIKEVVVDLRAVRRELESGPKVSVTPASRKGLLAGAAAVVAFLAVLILVLLWPESDPPDTLTGRSKPTIAVLFFDNLSQDPELDWLRVGIADMMVTDLSQFEQLKVVTIDRMYQLLKEAGRVDEPVTSFDIVKEVAQKSEAQQVVLGTFARAGETIRISARLQEVASEEVLRSHDVEGVGEQSVFTMVDELTELVCRSLLPLPVAETDKHVWELTTSQPEAYRYFIEGGKLSRQSKWAEAVPLVEKAVEIDPSFAGAWYRLAVLHFNLGDDRKAEEAAERAIKLGRLDRRQQLLLETRVGSLREDTYEMAIDAFEELLSMGELSPASVNLANRYWFLERYEQAVPLLEKYRAASGGRMTVTSFNSLAEEYTALGRYDQAHQLIREALAIYPENASLHNARGNIYLFQGSLDDAAQAYVKAVSLAPDYPRALQGLTWTMLLRADLAGAFENSRRLLTSSNARFSWQSSFNQGLILLYRGKSAEAVALITSGANEILERSGRMSGMSRCLSAHVLLETEHLKAALEDTTRAQEESEGNLAEWMGIYLQSVVEAKLGQLDKAGSTAKRLAEKTKSIPTHREVRRCLHLEGELARLRGDTIGALNKLRQAETMLPVSGFGGVPGNTRIGPQPYVPIWYSLASAYLEAGDDDQAAEWFRRIAEANVERVEWPIYFVRSFYFLGKIHENRGEMDEARKYYQNFVDYWGDGDMDRERVEEAKRKIDL
jgi:serine/threonine protein kinase/tetratricopeptide (TPR) repeat protein